MYKSDIGFPNLGTTIMEAGINFGIYCKDKNDVVLNVYEASKMDTPSATFKLDKEINKSGDIWHIFLEGAKEGLIYSWNIDEFENILDPYALSYTGEEDYSKRKAIAVKGEVFKKKHLNIPLKDSIIYEVHIGLFTKNKNSYVKFPGTYKGFVEKIPHLKDLGITTVEFLPIYEWDDYTGRQNDRGEELKKVWGYNPISFFAPTKKFSTNTELTSFDEVIEIKELVSKLHENGIEVILDVVYNHTAEDGNDGKVYNFKALNRDKFYMINDDDGEYKNYSGCGNTFNCNFSVSRDIILNSLKYWYLDVGVDGFRFDLASILGRDENGQWGGVSVLNEIAQDPILSYAKLISESWDLGGYYLGDMPQGWSEWNGKYRDVVRRFVKGDTGLVPELVKRIFGSPDIFKGRTPLSSINFISCHDGFTMHDIVSYSSKHNHDNGENNQDGTDQNLSYNWGEEGETENEGIIAIRRRLIKNFFTLLLISQGVPMILMGDECGRTQKGNNNAYCQDNELSWFDWERAKGYEDIYEFVKKMIELRKSYSIFRKPTYWSGENEEDNDVILHGVKPNSPDFSYHSLSVALELLDKESNTSFYIALNSFHEDLTFELPQSENGKVWEVVMDTSRENSFVDEAEKLEDGFYNVTSRSFVILKREN